MAILPASTSNVGSPFRAQSYTPPLDVSTGRAFQAAFELNNPLFQVRNIIDTADRMLNPGLSGYDPIPDVPDVFKTSEFLPAYENARNKLDVMKITSALQKDIINRNILQKTSTPFFLMSNFVSAAADPIQLFFPGSQLVNAARGISKLRSALTVSGLSIVSTLASEPFLQAGSPTRTAQEAATETLFAGLLGGGIGAVIGRTTPVFTKTEGIEQARLLLGFNPEKEVRQGILRTPFNSVTYDVIDDAAISKIAGLQKAIDEQNAILKQRTGFSLDQLENRADVARKDKAAFDAMNEIDRLENEISSIMTTYKKTTPSQGILIMDAGNTRYSLNATDQNIDTILNNLAEVSTQRSQSISRRKNETLQILQSFERMIQATRKLSGKLSESIIRGGGRRLAAPKSPLLLPEFRQGVMVGEGTVESPLRFEKTKKPLRKSELGVLSGNQKPIFPEGTIIGETKNNRNPFVILDDEIGVHFPLLGYTKKSFPTPVVMDSVLQEFVGRNLMVKANKLLRDITELQQGLEKDVEFLSQIFLLPRSQQKKIDAIRKKIVKKYKKTQRIIDQKRNEYLAVTEDARRRMQQERVADVVEVEAFGQRYLIDPELIENDSYVQTTDGLKRGHELEITEVQFEELKKISDELGEIEETIENVVITSPPIKLKVDQQNITVTYNGLKDLAEGMGIKVIEMEPEIVNDAINYGGATSEKNIKLKDLKNKMGSKKYDTLIELGFNPEESLTQDLIFSINNEMILSHEIGHIIDDKIAFTKNHLSSFENMTLARELNNISDLVDLELSNFTKKYSNKYIRVSSRTSVRESFAQAMSLYLRNPQKAIELAPKFFGKYKNSIDNSIFPNNKKGLS